MTYSKGDVMTYVISKDDAIIYVARGILLYIYNSTP